MNTSLDPSTARRIIEVLAIGGLAATLVGLAQFAFRALRPQALILLDLEKRQARASILALYTELPKSIQAEIRDELDKAA